MLHHGSPAANVYVITPAFGKKNSDLVLIGYWPHSFYQRFSAFGSLTIIGPWPFKNQKFIKEKLLYYQLRFMKITLSHKICGKIYHNQNTTREETTSRHHYCHHNL